MPTWLYYSLLVVVLWGIVGIFQKLGSNRISAQSLIVWLTVGYVVLLPWLVVGSGIFSLGSRDLLIGTLAGITNGLGAWCLFASLGEGAKASVAVPLTALNPLLTIVLAMIFLEERLTSLQWLGILVAVIAGVLISFETTDSHATASDPDLPGVSSIDSKSRRS